MKSLLNKDDKYQITEKWVEQFNKVLFADFDLLMKKESGVYFWCDNVLFSLWDNGLEFNLDVVNVLRFDSIHYVKDKKAMEAEELALEIVGMVKESSAQIKKANKLMDVISKTMKDID